MHLHHPYAYLCPVLPSLYKGTEAKDLILTIIFRKDCIPKCHHILGLRLERLSGGRTVPHHS